MPNWRRTSNSARPRSRRTWREYYRNCSYGIACRPWLSPTKPVWSARSVGHPHVELDLPFRFPWFGARIGHVGLVPAAESVAFRFVAAIQRDAIGLYPFQQGLVGPQRMIAVGQRRVIPGRQYSRAYPLIARAPIRRHRSDLDIHRTVHVDNVQPE